MKNPFIIIIGAIILIFILGTKAFWSILVLTIAIYLLIFVSSYLKKFETGDKDLTKLGSFLMMGLIGIIIASIVNIFLKSTQLEFIVSLLGVIIFVGLTAYDTQKIKEMYFDGGDSETMAKKSIMGALTLYLDFINLFVMLLRFFGQRRD